MAIFPNQLWNPEYTSVLLVAGGLQRGMDVRPRTLRREPIDDQGNTSGLAVKMQHRPELTADYYREKAAEIKRFAMRSRSPEVRLELVGIAELFDRMAERAERRAAAGKVVRKSGSGSS